MAELDQKAIEKLRGLAESFVDQRKNSSVGAEIGHGASAAVFELFFEDEKRALKVYDPKFFEAEAGAAERRRLRLQKKLISHRCHELVQILDVHLGDPTCFVEMEYAPGIDLNRALQSVPVESIQPLIMQLVTAVTFLEVQGLVHRDIKPSNIKVSSDFQSLKLLDLGVLRELDDDDPADATAHGVSKPFIATAQYSSPEYLFWLHQPGPDLWRALSIYQVGAVLHDMLTRKPLFADEVATGNRYVLAMAVLQKIPNITAAQAPVRLPALAARCLTKHMERRLAAVSWDDFKKEDNQPSSVVRRVQQVRETGLVRSADAVNIHERTLRRSELRDDVLQKLHSKMQENFVGCQLELVDRNKAGGLIFCLPKTELVVDVHAEFRWSETSKDEMAAVLAFSILRHRATAGNYEQQARDVATLALGTAEQVADALYEYVVQNIGLALDIAEASGGVISDPVVLGERVK